MAADIEDYAASIASKAPELANEVARLHNLITLSHCCSSGTVELLTKQSYLHLELALTALQLAYEAQARFRMEQHGTPPRVP